jgi:hypothetical protein
MLRNFDTWYGNDHGQVATLEQFVPRSDRAEESVDLFIPLSQLHLGPGYHALECWALVFNHPRPGAWNTLATSQAQPFWVMMPVAPQQQAQPQQQFAQPADDPMPRPNYHWAHGQHYTETALLELNEWFRRHPNVRPGWDFWRDQTMRDIKNEQDWIHSTFSGLGNWQVTSGRP